jgi:chemotaxis protein methyltransferase CheR
VTGSGGGGVPPTNAAEVRKFRELLARCLGWTFSENDTGQLWRVLRDRADRNQLRPGDYLTRLAGSPWPAEITELAATLSITETYFFRHGEQFRALREQALPARVTARAAQRVLRMMSVACSSGEEAYSLAIVGREVCPDPDWIIRVVGVDANPVVLRRATAARYSGWSLRETPDEVRCRWFRRRDGDYRDGEYQVIDEVRSLVRFQAYNVTDDDPVLWRPGQYDVIFCRNLLMYLTAGVGSVLVRRMTSALAPGGYLFLGHTDSLGSRPDDLAPRHTRGAFYYQRPPTQRPAPIVVPAAPRVEPPPVAAAPDAYGQAIDLLQRERFAEALALTGGPAGRTGRDLLLCGVLLALTGRLAEAAAVAREMIDRDGLHPDAHQLLGLCHEGAGTVDQAIGQYRLAAYLDAGFAMPRLRIGQLARARGDDRDAAAALEQALDLLAREQEERITLFGGGFGRISLIMLCRSELDTCGARR